MGILSEDNLKIYLACSDVPDEAKKPIQAGRLKGMTDINPMWRLKKITEVFGACGVNWVPEIVSETVEEFDGLKEKLVKVTMNVRYRYQLENGEYAWSEPLPGVGTAKIVTMEKNGAYLDDNAYKKARTDALGACFKWLGGGGSVYWQNDPGESKYQTTAVEYVPKGTILNLVEDAKKMGFKESQVLQFFGVSKLDEIRATEDKVSECRSAMKKVYDSKNK